MEEVVIRAVSDRLVKFRQEEMGGKRISRVGHGVSKKAERLERVRHVGGIRKSSV